MWMRGGRENSETFFLRYKIKGRKEEKDEGIPENEGSVAGHVLRDVQPARAKGKMIKKSKEKINNNNNINNNKSKDDATTHCLDARKVTKRMSIVILR